MLMILKLLGQHLSTYIFENFITLMTSLYDVKTLFIYSNESLHAQPKLNVQHMSSLLSMGLNCCIAYEYNNKKNE